MTQPPAPPFDPDANRSQHFVPKLWQKRFADHRNNVYGRYRANADPLRDKRPAAAGRARVVSIDDTMTGDWVYTVFNGWWWPSNHLEQAISKDESRIAAVFDLIADPSTQMTRELRLDFCKSIGFAVCRTPTVMRRGHELSKKLANFLACIHDFSSKEEFLSRGRTDFGIDIEDAYDSIAARTADELLTEAQEIVDMSPQHPYLPEQNAILGADAVGVAVSTMRLTLLDAPATVAFILGDAPLPDKDLSHGFILPLSAKLALRAEPAAQEEDVVHRAAAFPQDVADSNLRQYEMSLDVVIGPDGAVLDALG